ncbi:MAG: metal ABC transporter solute-binding protein, Zn/Mn family [Phycisphaerales bacterium]
MYTSTKNAFMAIAVVLAAVVMMIVSACKPAGNESTSSAAVENQSTSKIVVVDIAPIHGLVKPILDAGYEIHTLIQPGQSPHSYQLKPSDASLLARADLVVHVGAGLSPELARAIDRHASSQAVMSMADLTGIVVPDSEEDHTGHDHVHGEHCAHGHGEVDPHLWLDPQLVRAFVHALAEQSGAVNTDAVSELIARIDFIDAQYAESLESKIASTIITQHHAFSRLLTQYEINISDTVNDALHLDPSPASIAVIADQLRSGTIDAVFVEPQYPDTLARKLSELSGVPVGVLDPLGTGDWVSMMESNLSSLIQTLPDRVP